MRDRESFNSVQWDADATELYHRIKVEAAAIGDDYLGTHHLLLAFVATSPVERDAIGSLQTEDVRAAIVAVREPRNTEFVVITPWSQTTRLKLAIEHAMQLAFDENRPVRPADLWSGLLCNLDTEATTVLSDLGVQVEDLANAFAHQDVNGNRADSCPARDTR